MITLRSRLLTLSLLTVTACASTNHYRPAVANQERCCQWLRDASTQRACLADIPRTSDEMSDINHETFQCVDQQFACDPATGRATRDSAQRQLDCLNGLESTQHLR